MILFVTMDRRETYMQRCFVKLLGGGASDAQRLCENHVLELVNFLFQRLSLHFDSASSIGAAYRKDGGNQNYHIASKCAQSYSVQNFAGSGVQHFVHLCDRSNGSDSPREKQEVVVQFRLLADLYNMGRSQIGVFHSIFGVRSSSVTDLVVSRHRSC